MILELKSEQKINKDNLVIALSDLKSDITTIKTQLAGHEESIEFAHAELNDIKAKAGKAERSVDALQLATEELQSAGRAAAAKLNQLEAYTRQWSVRVAGIAESEGEACKHVIAKEIVGLRLPGITEVRDAEQTIEVAYRLGIAKDHGPHGTMVIPRVKTATYGSRMFCRSGPVLWNGLLRAIRDATFIYMFKTLLKTFKKKLLS